MKRAIMAVLVFLCMSFAVNGSNFQLRNSSLVSVWELENNINDYMIINNGSQNGVGSFVSGHNGLGYGFIGNSSSDYISIADDSTLRNNEMTISFWIKANEYDYMQPIGKFDDTPEFSGFNFQFRNDGEIWFVVGRDSDKDRVRSDDNGLTYSNGGWSHIVGVKNATDLKLYINGTLAGTTPSTREINNR
jgi:hypothetical protein